MGEPVEQCCRHLGVAAEHRRPLAEAQVRGDEHGRAGVQLAEQMEQQLAAALGERQIAELVQHHEIDAGELVGELAAVAGTRLGLQPVDQIDDVEEPGPCVRIPTSPAP